MKAVVFALGALLALPLAAQDEQPAESTRQAPRLGTTVIGERESPIGLYITPWRRSTPGADIDRPARLLDQGLEPVDPDVYARQVSYDDKLTQNRASKSGADTP